MGVQYSKRQVSEFGSLAVIVDAPVGVHSQGRLPFGSLQYASTTGHEDSSFRITHFPSAPFLIPLPAAIGDDESDEEALFRHDAENFEEDRKNREDSMRVWRKKEVCEDTSCLRFTLYFADSQSDYSQEKSDLYSEITIPLARLAAFRQRTVKLWLGLPSRLDVTSLMKPTSDDLFNLALQTATSFQHGKIGFTFVQIHTKDCTGIDLMTMGTGIPISRLVHSGIRPSMKMFQHYDNIITELHRHHEEISEELAANLDILQRLGIQKESSREKILRAFIGEKLRLLVLSVFRHWNQLALDELRAAHSEREKLRSLAEISVHKQQVEVQTRKTLKVVESALMDQTKLTALRMWRDVVCEERDARLRADEQARFRVIQQRLDAKRKKAFFEFIQSNDALVVQSCFKNWQTFVKEEHLTTAMRNSSDLECEVQRLQVLHQQHIQKALMFMLGDNDAMLTHTIFGKWCEATRECKREKEVSALEDANDKLRKQAASKLAKSLMIMVGASASYQSQLVFKAWVEFIDSIKDERRHAIEQEAFQRTASHLEQHRRRFALQMAGANTHALIAGCFRTWREVTNDTKMDKMMAERSSFQEEVHRLRALHQGHVQKTLSMFTSSSDSALLHTTFSKWREVVDAERRMQKVKAREEELQGEVERLQIAHRNHLQKTLMAFCSSSDSTLLKSFFSMWREITEKFRSQGVLESVNDQLQVANRKVQEQEQVTKQLEERVLQLEEEHRTSMQQTALEHAELMRKTISQHRDSIRRTLESVNAASEGALLQKSFGWWWEGVKSAQDERELDMLKESCSQVTARASDNLRQSVMMQISTTDNFLTQQVFTAWASLTKQKTAVTKTLPLLRHTSDQFLRRQIFQSWATDTKQAKAEMEYQMEMINLRSCNHRLEKQRKRIVRRMRDNVPLVQVLACFNKWEHVISRVKIELLTEKNARLQEQVKQAETWQKTKARTSVAVKSSSSSATLLRTTFAAWATVNQCSRLDMEHLSDEMRQLRLRLRADKWSYVQKVLHTFMPPSDALRKIVHEWRHVTCREVRQSCREARTSLNAFCTVRGRWCAEKMATLYDATLVHAVFSAWARSVYVETTSRAANERVSEAKGEAAQANFSMARIRTRFTCTTDRLRNREVLHRWYMATQLSRRERQFDGATEKSRNMVHNAILCIERGHEKAVCSTIFRAWLKCTAAGLVAQAKRNNISHVQNHTKRFLDYSDHLLLSTTLIVWKQQVRMEAWSAKTERTEEQSLAMVRHTQQLAQERINEALEAAEERIKQLERINRSYDERERSLRMEMDTLQDSQEREREAHREHEKTLAEQITFMEGLREKDKRKLEAYREKHDLAIQESEMQKEQTGDILQSARSGWQDLEKRHVDEIDGIRKQLQLSESRVMMLTAEAEMLPHPQYLLSLFRMLLENKWGTVQEAFQANAVHNSKAISKHVFAMLLAQLGIADTRLGDALWSYMDVNRSGSIDFKEFAGLTLNLPGSPAAQSALGDRLSRVNNRASRMMNDSTRASKRDTSVGSPVRKTLPSRNSTHVQSRSTVQVSGRNTLQMSSSRTTVVSPNSQTRNLVIMEDGTPPESDAPARNDEPDEQVPKATDPLKSPKKEKESKLTKDPPKSPKKEEPKPTKDPPKSPKKEESKPTKDPPKSPKKEEPKPKKDALKKEQEPKPTKDSKLVDDTKATANRMSEASTVASRSSGRKMKLGLSRAEQREREVRKAEILAAISRAQK